MKYRHTLDAALGLDDPEIAVLNVLMLRGAQTPGELKGRTERLHRFADMEDLGGTLERLIERQLAARLERRPGQREERYTHLLGSEDAAAAEERPAAPAEPPEQAAAPVEAPAPADSVEQRFERIERQIAELRTELQALREQRSG
jgi:uncharacterized protein YceH (UPF0502 family)